MQFTMRSFYTLSTLLAVCITACAMASTLQAQVTETSIQCSLGKQCQATANIVFTPSMGSPKSLELLHATADSSVLVVDLLFESVGIDPAMPFNVLLRFDGEPTTSGTLLLVGTERIAPKTLAIYSPNDVSRKVMVFPASGPHPLPRMYTDREDFSWFLTGKGLLAIKFMLTPQGASAQTLLVTVWDKAFRIPLHE